MKLKGRCSYLCMSDKLAPMNCKCFSAHPKNRCPMLVHDDCSERAVRTEQLTRDCGK
jgi:hypothetical protein